MKSQTASVPMDPRLNEVTRRIADWRRTRPHLRAPMPAELWDAVAALTDRFTSYELGRWLNLDRSKIRARRLSAGEPAATPELAKIVRLAPIVLSTPCQSASAASIEIENTAGCKLRVTTTSDALASLVRTFIGGEL